MLRRSTHVTNSLFVKFIHRSAVVAKNVPTGPTMMLTQEDSELGLARSALVNFLIGNPLALRQIFWLSIRTNTARKTCLASVIIILIVVIAVTNKRIIRRRTRDSIVWHFESSDGGNVHRRHGHRRRNASAVVRARRK